jgi:hypothetical protein
LKGAWFQPLNLGSDENWFLEICSKLQLVPLHLVTGVIMYSLSGFSWSYFGILYLWSFLSFMVGVEQCACVCGARAVCWMEASHQSDYHLAQSLFYICFVCCGVPLLGGDDQFLQDGGGGGVERRHRFAARHAGPHHGRVGHFSHDFAVKTPVDDTQYGPRN